MNAVALLVIMAANGTFSFQTFTSDEQCKIALGVATMIAMDKATSATGRGMSMPEGMCWSLVNKKEIK